ncbi:DbpA RNA binding domain-containing protein, partial [Methanocorpusculum sp.]|nr:DbpA RNA binding domain-containing protein [Methanocorpusculum sp.]
IDLYSNYSFVEVPLEHADHVAEVMGGATIRGKELQISVATPRPERDGNDFRRDIRVGGDRGGFSDRKPYNNNRGSYGNKGGNNYRRDGDRRGGDRRGGDRRNFRREPSHDFYD